MSAPLVYADADILRILTTVKTIAMVGASANPARPSYSVLRFLLEQGYRVFPVNPGQSGREILGATVYPNLASIPDAIDMVDVFRASDAIPALVDEVTALEPKPKVIWTQLGLRHDDAARTAEAAGIEVVMDRCPKIEYARLHPR